MTRDSIVLRLATPDDAPMLRLWDEAPHVQASDPDSDWGWESELKTNPDWRQQLVAERAGRPFGFLQIMDPAGDPDRYWGDVDRDVRAIDIWIGPADHLGKGYGSEMMRQALARCFAEPGVVAVLIDPLLSNTRAHRFYRRLGFVAVGERWFDDDHCLVHELTREAWLERHTNDKGAAS
ncbi:MAG: GNAT family N-acetyltransferase [Pseudomonadota bacterium]